MKSPDLYSIVIQETESRRLQGRLDIHNQEKESLAQKFQKQKESKEKLQEEFHSITDTLFTSIKAYKNYVEVMERCFVSSFENLLLSVDFKFDTAKEARTLLNTIELTPKQLKILSSHSKSLLLSINEEKNRINYDELDKIFSKTVKDLRGRKYLDEKEANALFENVLGPSQDNNKMNTSGRSTELGSNPP